MTFGKHDPLSQKLFPRGWEVFPIEFVQFIKINILARNQMGRLKWVVCIVSVKSDGLMMGLKSRFIVVFLLFKRTFKSEILNYDLLDGMIPNF